MNRCRKLQVFWIIPLALFVMNVAYIPAQRNSAASFGTITATTVIPRIIQFGLKYIF